MNNDTVSDNESDLASVYSADTDVDNIDNQETQYEEKMLQLIENCAEKSVKIRIPALRTMCETMQHRYFPDFIMDRKITIIDIAEKSLRRGKIEEQELAAKLLILLIIQTGGEHNDFKTVCQILSTAVNNPTCLQSLAMFYFLTCEDIGEIVNIMVQFEQIFAKASVHSSEEFAQLNVEAMKGWGLLACRIPPGDFCQLVNIGTVLK